MVHSLTTRRKEHCRNWPHLQGHEQAVIRYQSERDVIASIGLTPQQEEDIYGGVLARLTGA